MALHITDLGQLGQFSGARRDFPRLTRGHPGKNPVAWPSLTVLMVRHL